MNVDKNTTNAESFSSKSELDENDNSKYNSLGLGVEYEDVGITNPFDPAAIKVETKQMSLDTLIKRMKEGEIELSPDFQRNEVWKVPAKSRLIESLLIRIPLPAFYMDATNEESWLVVDGLQRLSTLRDFIIKETLVLTDLEFLEQFNEKKFSDLPRSYQRRIEETQVTVYLIEKGTPNDVKFNIFKRINTGGLPLSSQEIRHALNQGPVTTFLKELAESEIFIKATDKGIRDNRMSDRECVIRFFAFVITPYSQYNGDFDAFLGNAMARMNRMSSLDLKEMKRRFDRAMSIAIKIFGRNAFRKQFRDKNNRHPINKALFESWSVNLEQLTDHEVAILEIKKKDLIDYFMEMMENQEFNNTVTQGTGNFMRVRTRFEIIQRIIQIVLSD
ncbi:MAG: DUF262 domain-containing protein [Magnetococcales bacterium]|nr:DUF262 domain-containing protein [Magnetococcales bacterium]